MKKGFQKLLEQKLHLFILVLFSAIAASNCGKTYPISMATSTSLTGTPVFDLLNGKKWQAEPGAEYVKVHLYFDEPLMLKEAEINACDKFDDNVHMFINFDEFSYNLKKKKGDSKLSVTLDTPVNARSVTFNLNRNSNPCLSSVSFWDKSGKKVKFSTPEIVAGEVKPSKTSKSKAYHPLNLFDSRYETAWASSPGEKDIFLDFNFANETKITALKIWNGYQRSPLHCIRNGRVKTIEVTGDGNYNERISVADEMDSQIVKLPKPFKGKNLHLRMAELYRGELEGVVISELRFLNGNHSILFNPAPLAKDVSTENRELFRTAGFEDILNKGLGSYEDTSTDSIDTRIVTAKGGLRIRESASTTAPVVILVPQGSKVEYAGEMGEELKIGNDTGHWIKVSFAGKTGWAFDAFLESRNESTASSSTWKLRLRSDGSLYIQGTTEKSLLDYESAKKDTTNTSFYAVGNFEAEKSVPNEIDLNLFGFVRVVEVRSSEYVEMGHDCNGCGRDCAQVKNNKGEKVFIQKARLIKSGNKYFLLNKSPNPQIPFTTVELEIERPLQKSS